MVAGGRARAYCIDHLDQRGSQPVSPKRFDLVTPGGRRRASSGQFRSVAQPRLGRRSPTGSDHGVPSRTRSRTRRAPARAARSSTGLARLMPTRAERASSRRRVQRRRRSNRRFHAAPGSAGVRVGAVTRALPAADTMPARSPGFPSAGASGARRLGRVSRSAHTYRDCGRRNRALRSELHAASPHQHEQNDDSKDHDDGSDSDVHGWLPLVVNASG
jgi:hypothetical protein